MIREAQALAQLSHPNVVAVHDAGTFEDDVFIAMEMVEGKTLDAWVKGEKRSVQDILEVMIAAGRGLSAAHKAGLVHRDFKPGNVMVGDDGRVRVLDFGLARAADQEELNEQGSEVGLSQKSGNSFDYKEVSSDSSPNLLQSPLTNAGGVLGTPLYMAPEQHLGLKTGERTDQFGFCVVLYEALYGKRPFAGRSMEELKSEVIRQQVCVPRPDTDVPAWLWKTIYKGLSVKPEDRYPSIDSILEDLDKDPEEVRRQKRLALRRKLFVVVLILLTITLPIGVWYGLRYRTFQLCKAAEGEFAGVWDVATKASMRKAFVGTEKSFAQETWERVVRIVDKYHTEWMQMRSDVCEARLIRGTQSEELFDLRMSCLRKLVGELGALANVFTKADAGIVQKAVQASSSITKIAICADEGALRAPYPPPKTTEIKAKVASIREKLAEVVALEKTGKYRDGLELVKNLVQEAKAVDYRPVQAETLYWLGSLLDKTGEYKEAEATLFVVARLAGESRDTLLAAKAMDELVSVLGYQQDRHEAGLLLGRSAEVMLSAAGGNDIQRSLHLQKVGAIYLRKAEYKQALQCLRKALVIQSRAMGSKHPDVAITLNKMGLVLYNKNEYDQALEYYHKAMEIMEKTLGPKHPDLAPSLNNIGIVYLSQGEYDKALEYLRKSLSIAKLSLGPKHPRLGLPLHNIGNLFYEKGEDEKALEYYFKAMDMAKSLGAEHPGVGETLCSISGVFKRQGRYNKALQYYNKALEIMETALGAEHPLVASPLHGIGDVLVYLGRAKQGLEPLERAFRICKKKPCEPELHRIGLFALARAIVATSGDKERAIKLAKQARVLLDKTPKKYKKESEELNAWLQKHGASNLAKKVLQ